MSEFVAEGPGAQIVDFLHKPCGHLVFRWKGECRPWMRAESARIILPDGTRGAPGDSVWCEVCCRDIREGEIAPLGGWR